MSHQTIPLCVDLDGTLVKTDLLHESALELAKTAPLALLRLPGWLARGKAVMKQRLSDHVDLAVAHLPYRQEVIAMITTARDEGREIVLATASDQRVAMAVANHLGLFDRILASDGVTNLSAEAKARQLVADYGEGGFDYVGNSADDLAVWRRARRAIIVSHDRRLHARLAEQSGEIERLASAAPRWRDWMRSLRPHQWLKNLLIFVPLLAAHRAGDARLAGQAIVAFVAFCAAASSVYLVNDLVDLSSDRRHHSKRRRPFAAGSLPVSAGILMAPVALIVSLGLGFVLPPAFTAVLGFYLILTSIYSFWLKRQVLVDVMLLAGLYTLRIIAGAAATGVVPSFWLLAFSMFFFLSLAMVKRHQELHSASAETGMLAGRGYMRSDLPVLMALGSASGLMAVMVLALYINSPIVISGYREPIWLWLVPPLMLYWTGRLWMKTQRGEIHDDPVVFALRDRQSLVLAAMIAAGLGAAAVGWRPW
ncbi:UbiA family prenyltransferase [Novosphingobium piscinae]|uniref:UbiA family prenyltransferase n=1 Tax=Novosphingobium piscinae TaxID=1507448 RepID=A0A7X1KNY6_9SPHN|nr:UbiA family prenyltransferase [Novosphingobium piscinae]MBC2668127.1 UbiA family prenyltransferase [Novosphingobium piscinae]